MAVNNYPNNNDQNPFAPGQQTTPELSPYNAGYPVKERLNQIRDVSLVEGNIMLSGVNIQFPEDLATEPTLQSALAELQNIETALTTLNATDFSTETTLANLAGVSQDVLNLLQTGVIAVSGITLEGGTVTVDLSTLENLTSGTNAKLDQLIAAQDETQVVVLSGITEVAINQTLDVEVLNPVVVSGLGDVLTELDNVVTAIEQPLVYTEDSVSKVSLFVADELGSGGERLGPINYSASLDATIATVKGSAGNIFGINVINTNASDVYLKIFNSTSAVLGTNIPDLILAIPDSGAIFFLNDFPMLHAGIGIQVAVTANAAPLDTTAVTPVFFNLFYV